MIRFSFSKASTALKAADSVLVVANERFYKQRKFPRLLPVKAQKLLLELGKNLKPGLHGASDSSLTSAKPSWISAGAISNSVGRSNIACRPDAIERVVKNAGIGTRKKAVIVLVLPDQASVLPALNAVGRAFPSFSQTSTKPTANRITICAVNTGGAELNIDAHAKAVMEYARDSAELVDTPPTALNPGALAASAKRVLGQLTGVKVRVIVGDKLLSAGLGGIHAVGRTALVAPRMLIASYKPRGAKLHVALVGKGVTFDTGGLHIKGRGNMETMKCDMGGSAAVLGAFRALVSAKCKHQLSLIMCLAENAIGPASFKPDDIITMHSGKTVEINNTDAEGRLLLGDGVSYAVRTLGADVVFDAATLTGAQLISTGVQHAAIVTNNDALEKLTLAAGRRSGDLAHPLPFAPEFFKDEFKSQIADMKNSVKNRANAQSSCAAQFVYNHLEDTKVRWCHIDLAGPAFRGQRGTGYGVGLMAEAVLAL